MFAAKVPTAEEAPLLYLIVTAGIVARTPSAGAAVASYKAFVQGVSRVNPAETSASTSDHLCPLKYLASNV